ncbi:60S ribosomal protein L9 [Perkinsus chesapeaki]|uniref:60S ribosomal protein L9 n=1 Tax=Perkinsus chesapeaki TaxID=330153 RepID=A0A7J6LJV3_PERCH|nr:60S ribosomal protein L9 [Perkinsus chesapeaki]
MSPTMSHQEDPKQPSTAEAAADSSHPTPAPEGGGSGITSPAAVTPPLQEEGNNNSGRRADFPKGDPSFTPYAAMYDLMATKRGDTEPSELPPQQSRIPNYPNPDPTKNTYFTFPLVSADTCIVSDLDTPANELPDIASDKPLTGTSLCTFTGHQPIHVIIKDQQDEYFMDVLIAHRCLSPVWADYIAPDEEIPQQTAVMSQLKKRMSRISSTDSMDFVSCHSYTWELDSDAASSSSSDEVVSVVEVVDAIDKKGDNGKTDKVNVYVDQVLVTRKVKMRKRDVVLSPFRLAKKAWSKAFMPCYAGRPSGMRRSQSLNNLGTVSEPRHVKHHHNNNSKHHQDGSDGGDKVNNDIEEDYHRTEKANRRVSDNTDNVIKVTLKSRHIVVSGKYGKLERTFRHIPVDMKLVDDGRRITVEMWFGLTKSKACIRTVCSHIENMIVGVRQRYQYKLRFVYAHFPINSNITNNGSTIEIRNFLGEKVVRTVDMMPGVTVRKSDDVKDEVIVEGADLELVSRSAALIHQSTLVRHKDIRKFLDGIYVTESGVIDQFEDE